VRLLHAQLLTKPAPTFRVSPETNEFCTTPVSKGNGKVLKRGWSIIAAFKRTRDAVMRKVFLSTGTIGIGIVVATLIAWSHSVTPLQATTASSSINPTDMMATYKAPLPVEQWDAI
jgi:hypothetical protein